MTKQISHDQPPCSGLLQDPAASPPLEAAGRKKRAAGKSGQLAQPQAKPLPDQSASLTPDYVLNRLRQVAESCLASEPINASAANKALELLGKHLGVFSDKRGVEPEQANPAAPLAETVIYRIPDNERD